jgi:hypothetical protein
MDGKRNSWQRSWKNIDSNRCSITYRPGIGEMESEASLVCQAERENFKSFGVKAKLYTLEKRRYS